jgi:hypothetical protein
MAVSAPMRMLFQPCSGGRREGRKEERKDGGEEI